MTNKRFLAGCVVMALGALSGCGGGFFIDTNSTSTTTSSTSDYVYAVNPTSNTINEYSLSGAALTLIAGSPVTLPTGLFGTSVAVSRANTYVYVGGSQVISSYTIGSTGALTLNTATAAQSTSSNFIALDTSPDGQWLAALDSLTTSIFVYKITTSTGALSLAQQITYGANGNGSGTLVPRMLRFSPTGAYLGVALGTNGSQLFAFNSTTGLPTFSAGVPLGNGSSDNAVAFDGTSLVAAGNFFIARGGTVAGGSQILSYAINSGGTLAGTGNAVVSGGAPFALLTDQTGAYLYSANRADSTVSGYSFGSTVSTTTPLAALTGSPYAVGGTAPLALIEDKSKTYVVAAGSGGGKDVTLYTIGVVSPGVLSPVATAASGATGITALAATH